MALPDLTGQNIQDTYQRLLQVSGTLQVTDGTGSLVPLLEVTASYAISASHEINIEISSSHAQFADQAEVATPAVTSINSTNINVSASYSDVEYHIPFISNNASGNFKPQVDGFGGSLRYNPNANDKELEKIYNKNLILNKY